MQLSQCEKHIKKVRPNKELVKSLIEVSEIKELTVKSAKLDDRNISAFLPIAYDSLREIIDSVVNLKGYKVTSHVCLQVLFSHLYPEIKIKQFHKFRNTRNGINYYGKKISFEQGKSIIDQIFKMKKQMMELLDELIK